MAKKEKKEGGPSRVHEFLQSKETVPAKYVAVGYWRLLRQSVHLLIPPVA